MSHRYNRWMEDEANVFALCLLMPRDMIIEDLKEPIDLTDDSRIKAICKKYDVSVAMLIARMKLLKKSI